jgi:hypothetical protein
MESRQCPSSLNTPLKIKIDQALKELGLRSRSSQILKIKSQISAAKSHLTSARGTTEQNLNGFED